MFFRKLKRDSIPKLPSALDETDILLIQKEEEVSQIYFETYTYCWHRKIAYTLFFNCEVILFQKCVICFTDSPNARRSHTDARETKD